MPSGVRRRRVAPWKALCLASVLFIGGCATVSFNYDELPAGQFSGSLVVIWIGEGGSSGDGKFLFVPDPDDRLTFRRRDASAPGAVIRPGIMYTDGGSIPRIAQAFKGFSPWGYAPAYMVHDWLFVARHCLKDGSSDPRYQDLKDVTFSDSAKIIGEAIRTLVESHRVKRDDTAAGLITAAVGTRIAQQLWDEEGGCGKSLVTPADLALAERTVPGSTGLRIERARPPLAPSRARIVARVSF